MFSLLQIGLFIAFFSGCTPSKSPQLDSIQTIEKNVAINNFNANQQRLKNYQEALIHSANNLRRITVTRSLKSKLVTAEDIKHLSTIYHSSVSMNFMQYDDCSDQSQALSIAKDGIYHGIQNSCSLSGLRIQNHTKSPVAGCILCISNGKILLVDNDSVVDIQNFYPGMLSKIHIPAQDSIEISDLRKDFDTVGQETCVFVPDEQEEFLDVIAKTEKGFWNLMQENLRSIHAQSLLQGKTGNILVVNTHKEKIVSPPAQLVYWYDQDILKILYYRAGKKNIVFTTKASRTTIQQLLRKYRTAIRVRQANLVSSRTRLKTKKRASTEPRQHKVLQELSAILMPRALQAHIKNEKHLNIVPYGELATFPFGVLPINQRQRLIDIASLSLAPGFVGKLNKPSHQEDNPKAFLMGNPEAKQLNFSRLKGAEQEIRDVQALFASIQQDVPIYMDKEETRQIVNKNIETSNLVYFATHGIADSENPLHDSYLLLASTDPEYENTHKLRALDILNFDLSTANLVVLSACQTGLGETHDAGILGISRAFYVAGAQNILMSLWDVSDLHTQEFMTIFMQEYIQRKQSPAQALQKSMTKMKEKYPNNENYWAPFVLFSEY